MVDEETGSNIDLIGSFNDGELRRFNFWKVTNEEICNALKNQGEQFIAFVYFAEKQVKDTLSGGYKVDSNNISEVIEALEALKVVCDSLTVISKRLLDKEKVEPAWAITSFILSIENNELKYGKRKIANYANQQHQKYGADYEIPKIIRGETWEKIKHCITPKLRLWHIAYMIDPFNLWGLGDHKKKIMTDLYDAIDSGCLNANTSPPKIPKMIDDGQTIDRWEITLKEFKAAIDSGCMESYFKPYIQVWESYLKIHTRAFGRIENPEPFLSESLELTGSAINSDAFHKNLFSNISKQKEQGINDKSKAFQDAMKAVEPIEGHRIIDALDEYEQSEQKPIELNVSLHEAKEQNNSPRAKTWTPTDKTMKKYEKWYFIAMEKIRKADEMGEKLSLHKACDNINGEDQDTVYKGVRIYKKLKNK